MNLQQFHGGWRLGNKATPNHINFHQSKMRVKLAVQLIASRSVSDTLRYCHTRKYPGFESKDDVEATADFCLVNDQLWDLLNTKDKFGKGAKSPLRFNTKDHQEKILIAAEEMYQNLYLDKVNDKQDKEDSDVTEGIMDKEGNREEKENKKGKDDENNTLFTKSSRKTGPLGLLANIKGIRYLIDQMEQGSIGLEYLLSYKLQQDHLEVSFKIVHGSFSFNLC